MNSQSEVKKEGDSVRSLCKFGVNKGKEEGRAAAAAALLCRTIIMMIIIIRRKTIIL
jgi:hypothetical protein